jgi:PIN domain nuclease of toxin-antitoxin system
MRNEYKKTTWVKWPYHAQGLLELKGHHKDPFDRLLITQAKHETLRIVTYDAVFQNYLDDILLIWK